MCEIYKIEMFLFIQSKGAVYMTKVLLAGESWISSTTEYKGFDEFTSTKLEIGCVEFLDALRKFGHDVT
ncbi:cytoplasmic protein, partial [Gardnerella vaginalis]